MDTLSQIIGHEFDDLELLQTALTHRSTGHTNNERLEYLGDALLGFIIAEVLYHQFPQAPEGELTRLRAALVKKETLAGLGRDVGLGDHLILGSGELKSGGWRRDSILANAMEAIIGAIYLDSGFDVCRKCVLHLFRELLTNISPEGSGKDPKTELQEYLQARKKPLPVYNVIAEEGEAHVREFTIACKVAGIEQAVMAQGRTKRSAEQSAAHKVLELLLD
ncbi:MAG: ribonuclease III [Gammaproteobacteria bacterium]